jgi:uncharacterized membrane protein
MERSMLDREANEDNLRSLARAGGISANELEQALCISGIIPGGKAWTRFLNTLFLLLGSVFIIAGIIFFFAYNWASMSRLLKLGLVQAALLAAVFTTSYLGFEKLSGKTSLLSASLLTGALLALFGQIYQTGADAYELFLNWSALIAGWVLISQFAVLWLLLLVLLETTVFLYWAQVVGSSWFILDFESALLYLIIFSMNAAALAFWEFFALRRVSWLIGRWIPRTIQSAGFFFLVVPIIILILDSGAFKNDRGLAALLPALYLSSGGIVLWFYRTKTFDLYMIAAVLLSLIVLITVFLGKEIGNNYSGFLLLSLLIIGLSAGAAAWLRSIARLHSQEVI